MLILEKMDTSLRNYLEVHKKEEFPLSDKVYILRQVAQALSYLHNLSPPLVHHDLSPNNVLLNAISLQTKVTDFGMSRALDPSKMTRKSSVKGTHAFMPPEGLVDPPVYDDKLDIFSYGNIIVTTTTHMWPNPGQPTKLEGKKLIAVSELQRRQQYLDQFTPKESELFLPVVQGCLQNDPSERPTSIQLVTQMSKIERAHPRVPDSVVIGQLRQTLDEKNTVLDQSIALLHQKDTQLGQKEAQLHQKDAQLHQKDAQLHQKDAQLQENQKQLREKDAQLCMFQEEMKHLRQETSPVKKDLYHRIGELTTQLEEKERETESWKGDAEGLRAKLVDLEEKRTQQISSYEEQIAEIEAKLFNLQNQLPVPQSREGNLQQSLTALEVKCADVEEQHSEERESLNGRIFSLESNEKLLKQSPCREDDTDDDIRQNKKLSEAPENTELYLPVVHSLTEDVTAVAGEELQKGGHSKQHTISIPSHSVSSPLPQGIHEVDESELYLPVDDIVPKSVPHLLPRQVTAEATEKLQKGGPSKQYTISTLGHSVSSPLPQGVHEVDKSELYLPVDDIVPKSVPHLLPRQSENENSSEEESNYIEKELIQKQLQIWQISREEAKEALREESVDGMFLFRISTTGGAALVLSVWYQGKCKHFKVFKKGECYSLDGHQLFEGLRNLVKHYQKKCLPSSTFCLSFPFM
jgi:serine/threonine protein kinase